MFLRQLISSAGGKVSKNYSKSHLASTKFMNQCVKKDVKIKLLLFQFLLKIQSFGKSVKDKSSGE